MHKALYREGLTLEAARGALESMRGGSVVDGAEGDIGSMLDFLAQAERGIVR
jgi:UDP-N-acetylglucosamine acyltransferase